MAHEVFTGKSGGSSITYGGASIPTGWKKITIAEKGKPLAGQLDTTAAGDSAYSFTDDSLGGKGSPSCTVTVEGLMSKTDVHDSGLLASTIDATGDVVVTTGMLKSAEARKQNLVVSFGFESKVAGAVVTRAVMTVLIRGGAA